MTEVSIENEKEKNIDNKASQDVETFKQTPIQNSDLIKNELHPDDNIIEDISNDQPKIEQPKKCRLQYQKYYFLLNLNA